MRKLVAGTLSLTMTGSVEQTTLLLEHEDIAPPNWPKSMDWPCSAGLRFVYVRLMISLLTPCSKPRQESIATPPSVLAVDADVAIKVDGCLQGPRSVVEGRTVCVNLSRPSGRCLFRCTRGVQIV